MMELNSPKSVLSYQKMTSRGLIPDQLQVNPRRIEGLGGVNLIKSVNTQSPNYRFQTLLAGKEYNSYQRIPSFKGLLNKKQILSDTQEKIFVEVLGLVDQIYSLKESIVSTEEQTKQMQIQNPDVEDMVKYHGYSQTLTVQQCNDLEDQNHLLIKQIQQFQKKKGVGLEEVLKLEKHKHEELQRILKQASDPEAANKANIAKIEQLQRLISQLQEERQEKIKFHFPGIDILKNQNEELRQKTITNLRIIKMEQEEEKQLSVYLKKEEQNRSQFLEELKKFKSDFKTMKAENQALRDQLERKRKGNHKQNNSSRFNGQSPSYAKLSSDQKPSSLKVDSVLSNKRDHDRKDKLGQYQEFIRQMQESLKK